MWLGRRRASAINTPWPLRRLGLPDEGHLDREPCRAAVIWSEHAVKLGLDPDRGASGFKEGNQAPGARDSIAKQVMQLDVAKVLEFFLVAVVRRLALGWATAAILTASALLAPAARGLPGQETLLVLAVANGLTLATQPADSGFGMIKEYCNL